MGLDSHSVAFYSTFARYDADEILFDSVGRLRREARRWRLFVRALRASDVVHFNFGTSIMPRYWPASVTDVPDAGSWGRSLFRAYARVFELRDLPWLRRAGKAICVTYQGDDARQRDRSPAALERKAGEDELDERRRAAITTFDRYADRIYALNPDLLHVLPRRAEFLPYSHVDLNAWTPAAPVPESRPPIVVHAPTDRAGKGTAFVLDAVERLRADGVELDFRLVEGLSRAEARQVYEQADLLVDQVLIGWYGGLAVELMALGKPVIAYLREDDLDFLPAQMRADLPVISATSETLADVLRPWLTVRRGELTELGRRSRAFVERWHDPPSIALRLKADYEAIARR